MNIKKILLPVDGSTYSDAAATMAIDMAQDNNASIVLLNVRAPIPPEYIEPYVEELREALTKAAEEILAHYKEKLDNAKIDHHDLIIDGRVGAVIVEVAKDEDCDIIVMGSKGKSELTGLILGSATHKVLHTTDRPVLVVK